MSEAKNKEERKALVIVENDVVLFDPASEPENRAATREKPPILVRFAHLDMLRFSIYVAGGKHCIKY